MDSLSFRQNRAVIKVIGVGGCGGNALNRMIEAGIRGVEFAAMNTDAKDLGRSRAEWRLQLGEKLTKGLGVGGEPSKGKEAALESERFIKEYIADADMVFVTAGMGGGTGTGAAPLIARFARELRGEDALIVGVVTRPFDAEMPYKHEHAEEGIAEMRKHVDSLLIIPNERIFQLIQKAMPMAEAFRQTDEVLRKSIQAVSDIITQSSSCNVDFNDIRRIMAGSGEALIGIGESAGEGRHMNAVRDAINSPFLENASISGARGLIVNFTCGSEPLKIFEQKEVLDFLKEYLSREAVVKWGIAEDKELEGRLKITVVATGVARPGRESDGRRRTARPPETAGRPEIARRLFRGEEPSGARMPAYLRKKMSSDRNQGA